MDMIVGTWIMQILRNLLNSHVSRVESYALIQSKLDF